LMVIEPSKEALARAIFEKWDLDFAVIGRLTDTGRMVLKLNGAVVGDLPIDPLAEASPEYDRPWTPTPAPAELAPGSVPAPEDMGRALLDLVGSPDLCSRRWVWEQYDHMVMADTIGRPGGDAAVVRVHGTNKALAIATDCTPRYCEADAHEGAKQAVTETWRNITAVGGAPLAITDCLNFGNPEKPRIMGQFKQAVDGIAEACSALSYPVVSGNVSFYNETNGHAVKPTPGIGGVGILKDATRRASLDFKRKGDVIFLIGKTKGHLGASIFLKEVIGREEGAPPPVNLGLEKKNGDFVRALIEAGEVDTCHDLSDGGLVCALAEMCLAGKIGADVSYSKENIPAHALLFGEDQARYLIALPAGKAGKILEKAKKSGIIIENIGTTGGSVLKIGDKINISCDRMRTAHEGWFEDYMTKVR
ncbi:MAG: phosphoribosylformylglycinamidine synthase II, partial [Proteobacteria bacterium]|nr:phosphoribosylformylglycinamidine synthase II [Pseudomonadota bacterium]